MTLKISSYFSPFTDPYENLAVENYLLSKVSEDEKFLLFYKNVPAIVLGRFQNPWLECDIAKMNELGVKLVRRQSGGGTVYHDLHNLNFCFIEGKRDFDKSENNNCLISALNKLDINAFASGRSDLMLERDGQNYKFSGSAFKQKKDCSFHHGTLLLDSKLDILNAILRSPQKIENSKSTKSVRSNVVNLRELNAALTPELMIEKICNAFGEKYNLEIKNTPLPIDWIDKEFLQKMLSWDWIFGETPKFTLINDDFEIIIKKGKVLEFDALFESEDPWLSGHISEKIMGLELKKQKLGEFIQELKTQFSHREQWLESVEQRLMNSQLFN